MKSDNSHAHLGMGSGNGNTSVKNIGGGNGGPDNDPANMSQQHSVLNAFDFAAIDEMDPALGNSYESENLIQLRDTTFFMTEKLLLS